MASSQRSRLLRIGSVLFSRGFGSLLQFALNFVLGQAIGAGGLGVYYLFHSWTRLTNSVTNLGFPPYNLREVSTLLAEDRPRAAFALTRRCLLWSGIAGALVAVAFLSVPEAALVRLANLENAPGIATALRLAAVGGGLYALLRVLAEALKAADRANAALNLEFSLVPAGIVLLTLAAWSAGIAPTTTWIIVAHVALLAAAVVIAAWLWHRRLLAARAGSEREGGSADAPIRRRNVSVFWMLGFVNIAFSTLPIILMPQFVDLAADVGQFGLATRLVGLAATILAALASLFSPRFARYRARGQIAELRRSLFLSQLYSFLLYLPLFLVFTIFARPVLSLFGADFVAGAIYLWIMATGQLINSMTGLSGQLLNMTGGESSALAISTLSTVFLVAAIFLLGGPFGGVGVALGAAGTIALRNLAFLVAGLSRIRAFASGAAR